MAPAPPHDARPRRLGAGELLALGVNGIVGVGIFFAPSEIAGMAPGSDAVWVFALTGLAMVPVAIALAKLGAHVHEDGAAVLYARKAFGETAGFFVGWVTYVSALLSTSAVLVGLSKALLGAAYTRWSAVLLATLLALACAVGLKASARVWTGLTIVKLVPLIVLAVLLLTVDVPAAAVASGTMPTDWGRACLTATFVFQGFEVVPLLAGQARRPERSIPFAVLGSLSFATVLYLLLQHGAARALPDLAHESEPLVATARVVGGSTMARLVHVGTSVSALGIAFGMMTTTPRYLAALAVGTSFERERNEVPLRALGVTWLVVMGLILGLGELGEMLALSSLAVVLQFLVVALALVALARSRQHGLVPRDAWPAVPTLAVTALLMAAATGREWRIAGGLLVAGALFRFGYVRLERRSNR